MKFAEIEKLQNKDTLHMQKTIKINSMTENMLFGKMHRSKTEPLQWKKKRHYKDGIHKKVFP